MYCANYEAFFGPGTKLTVLDPKIKPTPPTVKVLPPSPLEQRGNRKRQKKDPKVTLVCVATDFYPDHISVSWQENGAEISNGVRTDDDALRAANKTYYSITSRLKVQPKKWFNPKNSFTCITSFYDGTGYVTVNDTINGAKGGGGMDREYLMKAAQTAKLSYSIFIAKSFLYGLFISIVVWKIRSSVGKGYE
ncbi:hypothetical protein AAFF_G00386950 [Aldrovandia affinis]|uniref:Ig-like domain-containing protein n=1 Tax=Aldrovandia affinis TaxID=143900 RepID=A0AAD7WLG1_9TELE|nr:hypothetical protein AAFF_G00386950 [Aldrovandia affinis]